MSIDVSAKLTEVRKLTDEKRFDAADRVLIDVVKIRASGQATGDEDYRFTSWWLFRNWSDHMRLEAELQLDRNEEELFGEVGVAVGFHNE